MKWEIIGLVPNTSAALTWHGIETQKSNHRDSVHNARRKNAGMYCGVFLGRTWKMKMVVLSVASQSYSPPGTVTTHSKENNMYK